MGRTTTAKSLAYSALALALVTHDVSAQSMVRLSDTATAARIMHFPSPRSATWLAIGSTLAPAVAGVVIAQRTSSRAGSALLVTGLVAGPAIGAWYGNTLSDSWSGMLLRAGGVAIAAAGASGCSSGARSLADCRSGDQTALVGGAALALGSAIYEVATLGDRVREHNAAVARAMVLPLFSPSMREAGIEIVVGF